MLLKIPRLKTEYAIQAIPLRGYVDFRDNNTNITIPADDPN